MKHFKKISLAVTMLCTFHHACAPVAAMLFRAATEPMHSINTFKDLQPFIGKIVLFDSDKYYFSGGSYSYQLHDSLRIAFICATVQSFINEEHGITMRRIVKKGAHGSMCALLPSTITTANLKMRNATAEECKTLHNAIINNQAELEYGILHEETFKRALNR